MVRGPWSVVRCPSRQDGRHGWHVKGAVSTTQAPVGSRRLGSGGSNPQDVVRRDITAHWGTASQGLCLGLLKKASWASRVSSWTSAA